MARGPITPGVGEHILKLRNEFELVPILGAGEGIPPTAILHRAPCGIGIGTPDDYRRMWLLNGLRICDHWAKIDECAVVFGLILRPDGFHGFESLLHQLMARGENRAVVFHLLFVPAIAYTKQKAAGRKLID